MNAHAMALVRTVISKRMLLLHSKKPSGIKIAKKASNKKVYEFLNATSRSLAKLNHEKGPWVQESEESI